jgi:hypothetical protein
MLLGTLLALSMLTKTDIAALQSSKLVPNATNNIATIAGSRAVVLAKATFATYSGPTGLQTVMSYLMPPNTLQPGDCFRVAIGGTALNNAGSNQPFGAVLVLTQGGTSAEFGYRQGTAPSAAANYFAWRSEILICTGVAGANGQYLSGGGQISSASYNANPRGNAKLPSSALAFTGYGNTLLTDTNFAGTPISGGTLVATAGAPVGGGMLANVAQQTFVGTLPILFEVKVGNLTQPNTTMNVASGVLEGL